jgi:hypothetical protein
MSDEERPTASPSPASPPPRPRRPPHPFYNWLSIAGAVLAVGSVTGAVFFALLDVVTGTTRSYPGVMLIPYAVPAFLGLILVVVGIVRERRRRARGLGPSITPSISIDLVRLTRRRPLFFILTLTVGAALIVFGFGYASLEVVAFSESNTFCGEVCHSVMKPEYQAFHTSPHSQLDCVECHVASGAEGFLFAKVNGVGQMVSMITGDYERPIPTPVHNMRPARELCETCHTRERMIGYESLRRTYFLADEDNTQLDLHMLVNVGGEPSNGAGGGIHYHMLLGGKVEYLARDEKRQQIGWVRVTRADGSSVEYENEYVPISDEEREALSVRTMDCLDCHNRPAHQFPPPTDSVNEALASGAISRDLPYIKREAVLTLAGDYETTEEALAAIEEHLLEFYEEEDPDVLEDQEEELRTAVREVQAIYRGTIFPEMEARWSTHPNNIGHRDFPGCFRCHNEDLISEDGDPVFDGCESCHLVLWQGEDGDVGDVSFPDGQEWVHPEDFEPFEEFTDCTECHDGGALLYE